jgi:uncharacterized membrane protein YqaE (UPF0057 family)
MFDGNALLLFVIAVFFFAVAVYLYTGIGKRKD